MFLAIDPGASGCSVILDADFNIVSFLHTPTIKTGSSARVNGAQIAAWLSNYKVEHAFIERVGAMPKQGVSSTFSFGHSAGLVEGIVLGAMIPVTLITPAQWKRHWGLAGLDKDAARSRAIQLYPAERGFDLKGKGQALADAVLLGRFGALKLGSVGGVQ